MFLVQRTPYREIAIRLRAVPRLQAYPLGGESRFVKTVLEGRNERGMPPWGGLITEAQARSIFSYVHALVPHIDFVPSAAPDERARQVFREVCASCHGRQGAGTTIAPSLQAFKGTDDEFVDIVLNGRAKTAMAPFGTIVSVEVARKIREFVRELGRTNFEDAPSVRLDLDLVPRLQPASVLVDALRVLPSLAVLLADANTGAKR